MKFFTTQFYMLDVSSSSFVGLRQVFPFISHKERPSEPVLCINRRYFPPLIPLQERITTALRRERRKESILKGFILSFVTKPFLQYYIY